MEKNAVVRYFCCEERIIVRVVEEHDNYTDYLEYYNPKVGGWIPSKEWYNDMFIDRVVNFKEISRDEAIRYINSSVEYFKRVVSTPIYLRRIYGLNLEFFNSKTGMWQPITNHDWYEDIDDYERVTSDEVKKYILHRN